MGRAVERGRGGRTTTGEEPDAGPPAPEIRVLVQNGPEHMGDVLDPLLVQVRQDRPDRDPDPSEAPETPLTEPPPIPVQDPPDQPVEVRILRLRNTTFTATAALQSDIPAETLP